MDSIYGSCSGILPEVLEYLTAQIEEYNNGYKDRTGEGVYEHMEARVKSEDSMREKCRTKELPETPDSALRQIHDAIGLRIISRFIDDIYEMVGFLKKLPGCTVVEEKDYISHAKPNGYRSYHMILLAEVPFEDIDGNNPGRYYVEIQLRTIAMDVWGSLEHQLKYKQDIRNQKLIVSELKRCADELASCDVSLQTIRTLIRESDRK